jgi:YD repeat-containing protein
LGGDLAAVGASRVYFQESFDFRVNISGVSPAELNLQNVTYGDGTIIRTDWTDVVGIWMLDDCTGIKLRDGRTFTATTPDTAREIRAEGASNALMLSVNALTPNGATRHNAIINLSSVRENSQITLRDGVYHLDLVENRELELQSVNMTLTSPISTGEIVPMVINFDDQTVTIGLDWVNMRVFSLRDNIVTYEFLDEPRGITTRDGTAISRITAQNDIIQMIYKEVNGLEGEQRLMLPASDSYLEIVTPAGLPPFNGTALAGTNGYFPRALNNTGGDCYPTNTAIPEANCPPTGNINPANGNLWLTMTDAVAFGDLLNLDVVRHYNSAYAGVDSPFGKGWTSAFLLDYNIVYDETTNSRTVTPVTVSGFAIGLDVTYAPRGIVTFTTSTGSKHQFVSDSADGTGVMRALTMPGWVVGRESIFSNWILSQDNGLVYEFDRAGRLIQFGYPTYGRVVTIDYPRTNLNGASEIGADVPVIITDHTGDFAPRQLELYYDSNHRIIQTILRDMTLGADESTCILADNCVLTEYTYSADGLLTGVNYADGQSATYTYDEMGRLAGVSDPRAPLAPQLTVTYDAVSGEANALAIGTDTLHQALSVTSNATSRTVSVTDRLGNTTSHTYTLAVGDLRAVGTTYQLTQSTSPLAGTGDRYEDLPTVYRWGSDQNALLAGFLTRIESRVANTNQGRATRDYTYTPNGQIQCMACAFQSLPRLEITYDQPLERRADVFRPTRVAYADGTTEQFTYDTNGLLTRYIDRDGADYSLTWSTEAPYMVMSMTRANDNTRWDYFYNPVGLIVSLVQTAPDDTLPYQVSYQWDGLGRLIGVTDGVLGRYSIDYPAPTTTDDTLTTQIIMTDPVGAVTISVFDALGRLIETRVEQNSVVIRKTTREYDGLGREIATTEWLGDIADGAELLPLTTTTTYTPTATYQLVDASTATILGETITITDPYGRTTIRITDALGRIRRTQDINGVINDYGYNASTVDNTTIQFGLQITQQTALIGTPFTNRVDYFFDIRRQLRGVRTGVRGDTTGTQPIFREWTINGFGDTARQRSMTASIDSRTVSLREVTWGDYVSGQPPTVNISQVNVPLNSGYNVEQLQRPVLGANYDFLGRAVSVDAEDESLRVVYCPLSTGGVKVVYGIPNGTPNCAGDNSQLSLSYDVHGRLIEAIDTSGRRIITYTPNVSAGAWDVSVAFSSNTGDNTWSLVFNPLGAVTQWTDENGVIHAYTYDTRGRLLASVVADEPEASQYFTYNSADKLTEQADGLGRGYLYNYDVLGRVVSKVDLRTADALSYSYTPNGLLSAVIASDGSTTIYVYEDRTNPNRLTRIVEPSGAQHRFTWNDASGDARLNNTLVYTDPFDNSTIYSYDGTGLLWRIDDPLPISNDGAIRRASEVYYTDDGLVTDWLRDVTAAAPTRPTSRLTLSRPAPSVWTVSDATTNGTGWSQNILFGYDGVLAGVGDAGFGYDALGRLVSVRANDNLQWSLGWSNTSTISFIDPYAGETVLTYDALHRLVSESVNGDEIGYTYTVDESNTPVMQVNHPTYGLREYVFSPGSARTGTTPTVFLRTYGQQVAYIYDSEGRLTQIVHQACSDVSYANIFDCITDDIPLYETRSVITYNSVGLPIRIANADGALETFAYDDSQRLISYQNANGRNFTYAYDNVGRLTRVVTATGVKLILRYNTLDEITGICRTRFSASNAYADCASAGGELESYAYDTLGRIASRTFATGTNNATQNFRYNGDGQMVGAGDVSYSYYPNIGLLAEMSVPNGVTAEFTYADLNTLASVGDTALVYDNFGNLIGQNDRTTNLTLAYDLATQTYTVADGANRMGYTLDARGYLDSIGFNDTEIVSADYFSTQGALDLLWNDNTLIAYTLDNARQTQDFVISGANEMSIFYDVSATGQTLRQNIILPFADGGYVVIYGYDNDERPLTMRVTDFQGLAVLFSQSITYNDIGLRTGEAWQFGDGTQVITRYTYGESTAPNQLSRRTVNVVGAQNRTYSYNYAYDARGNLTGITETSTNTVCASLRYDGQNRLTNITRASTDVNTDLRYDAYGRLVQAGDVRLSYRGNSDDVLALNVNNVPYYLDTVDNQPSSFQVGRGGDVTWLINDGRDRALQPYLSNSDPSNDVWLFDALGRYLPPVTPTFDDVCALNGLPENITAPLAVQPLADGAIWLAEAGLYIQDGRAYEVETGLYAQRAQSVDALGNVYEEQSNNALPYPIRESDYASQGLVLLREALMTTTINDTLTSNAVLVGMLPNIPDATSSLIHAETLAGANLTDMTRSLLMLPHWLETQYNIPSAYRDTDGYLRIPVMDTPAQGGYAGGFVKPFDDTLPTWDDALMSSIQAPNIILERLMGDASRSQAQPFSTYRAHASATPLLVQTWQTTHTTIGTPSDVLAWLPTTLDRPHYGAYALALMDELAGLSGVTEADVINEQLNDYLPTTPDLPPVNLEVWRADVFGDDVLNPVAGDMPTLPALPPMPSYRWGANDDWLHVIR